MKVNVKLDISDTERDTLADYIDGNQSKRLATRKDVNSFVQGCLDAALEADSQRHVFPANNEADEIQQLRNAGHNDSYIRGWLQVGRSR
jgi:hypothetical protein